ncbi:MAG TPA: 16S rRNA (guanine(966)-N(2))-methyltransferase RsmD [Polyangiaceae bacterium]|nr:16S rRNA (guanine(966)-N(2))-methyltransferase RsmD [Polyangiaceae bacterium]
MRVISGRLRSRRLHAPRGEGTRPTHDRVKEALFSMLGDISGYTVADLYAGTGALGIEALSRGARHACFVERNRIALECLRRNVHDLALVELCTIIARDLQTAQPDLLRLAPIDLAFCDPPWPQMDDAIALLSKLQPIRWLGPEGLLVLEHPARFEPPARAVSGLEKTAQRRWGDTAVSIFQTAANGDANHRDVTVSR